MDDPKVLARRQQKTMYRRHQREIKAVRRKYDSFFKTVDAEEVEYELPVPMDLTFEPQLSEHENTDERSADNTEEETSFDDFDPPSEMESPDEDALEPAEGVDIINEPEVDVNNPPEVAINHQLINEDPEIQEIRAWAVNYRIKNNALDGLLKILRRRVLPTIPKVAKTLLKTSKASYDIRPMTDSKGRDGEYVYISLKKQFLNHVNPDFHEVEPETGLKIVDIDVNVDGLKAFKSSKNDAWVLSCRIVDKRGLYKPFTISCYYGQGKPADMNLFLRDFLIELRQLSGCRGSEYGHGFTLGGESYRTRLR